jgi:hypothetical protein
MFDKITREKNADRQAKISFVFANKRRRQATSLRRGGSQWIRWIRRHARRKWRGGGRTEVKKRVEAEPTDIAAA